MNGLWVMSQDGTNVTFCRTIKVWESGRIVNNFGKEYVHLGDYECKSRAIGVLEEITEHILTCDAKKVFRMPRR